MVPGVRIPRETTPMTTALGESRCDDPRFRRTIVTRVGLVDEVFCVSCHRKAPGAVLCDTPSVTYICTDCVKRYGGLPLPEVSDEDMARPAVHT
mgnify:FL=1